MEIEKYRYQTLDGPHQFRLLELQSAASREDPLEFQLRTVAFDKHPKYAAISYTWDAQEFDQKGATCDGIPFPISQNCDKILRHVRPPLAFGSIYLWIDQICIDQRSPSDKALNVGEMGAIYQQATSVLVWTGAGAGDSDKSKVEDIVTAAEEAGDIGSIPDTITEHWVARYNLQRRDMSAKNKSSIIMSQKNSPPLLRRKRPRTSDPDADALRSFRSEFQHRRWFQRLWTFQEAIVPRPHRVYFLLGRYTVPLDMLNDRNYGLAHEFYVMRSTNRDKDFSDIVHSVRNRQCHDPRDRYFALYSVLRLMNHDDHADQLDKGKSRRVGGGGDFPAPDYTKRTKDVFIEAAYWAFGDRQDARFLYLAPLAGSEQKLTTPRGVTATLPSWVPDVQRLSMLQRASRKTFFPDREDCRYSAASRASRARFSVSGHRWIGRELLDSLTLEGIVLDTVDLVTDEIPTARTAPAGLAPGSKSSSDSTGEVDWERGVRRVLEQFLFGAFELGMFDGNDNQGPCSWMSVSASLWRAIRHDSSNITIATGSSSGSSVAAAAEWQERCLRYVFSQKASLTEETRQLVKFRKLIRDDDNNKNTVLPTSANLLPAKYFWPPSGSSGPTRNSFTDLLCEVEMHKLFITRGSNTCERGSRRRHNIGIALGDIKTGDRIVVAAGFSKVLILREVVPAVHHDVAEDTEDIGTSKRNDGGSRVRSSAPCYYSLVGHGFVDGFMDGSMWPAGNVSTLEKIVLL